jgi:ankyrin repeat protein
LYTATRYNNADCVKFLIERGADVNYPTEVALLFNWQDGWTPLFWAIYNGNFELVKFFITHNADINHQNNVASKH